jgi:hypothetical protein
MCRVLGLNPHLLHETKDRVLADAGLDMLREVRPLEPSIEPFVGIMRGDRVANIVCVA